MGVSAVAAYGWWATGLPAFSVAALGAVEAAGVAAIAVGARSLPARAVPSGHPTGRLGWLLLAAAVGGWELAAFFQHPREEHPTLSSLTEAALEPHPLRALAFAGWLALGVHLARR